jgi:hypothetical protein
VTCIMFRGRETLAVLAALLVSCAGTRTRTRTNGDWICEVSGWSLVTLSTGPDGNSARRLSAVTDHSSRCKLERFAQEAIVKDSMQAAILSQVTAELVSGPFAGTCASLGYWYDRQRCDVSIFLPKKPRPGSKWDGCSPF